MRTWIHSAWLLGGILAGAGCGQGSGPGEGGSRLSVTVTPLSLNQVSDVSYGLEVVTNSGDTVWSEGGINSQRFGDGRGAATYVGPCDASADANPNRVRLVVESITDSTGDTLVDGVDFQNPAPAGRPVELEVDCLENADAAVEFNLTVMRRAEQGFFDIGVNFSDIFCSAKLDCVDSETGADIKLLHRPNGPRDTTVVMALACTSGEDDITFLHFSDVVVQCGTPPTQQTYWLNPAAGLGNVGAVPPALFQTAIYQGSEQLAPYDKCYWNMAFGVAEGAGAADCHLVASATASSESWQANDGTTPDNTVYPYVSFDLQLTGSDGQVMCGKNPLNGEGSGVQTEYTSISGGRFTREMQCGGAPTSVPGLACRGTIGGDGVAFIDSPLGVSVAFGPSVAGPTLPDCAYSPHDPSCRSPLYVPPEGTHLGSCCTNACCGEL